MTYAAVTNSSLFLRANASEIQRFCGGPMFTLTNVEGAKIISSTMAMSTIRCEGQGQETQFWMKVYALQVRK
jgi:hypothetical protein